jgi:hypothetical protein
MSPLRMLRRVPGGRMAFEDVVDNFCRISVCMLPTGWQCALVTGEWSGESAGGCSNNSTVVHNPQFALSIRSPTTVVIALSQSDRRVGAGDEEWEYFSIGINVLYHSNSTRRIQTKNHFHTAKVTDTGAYTNTREVTLKMDLPMRGGGDVTNYILMPATFNAGEESAFVLRIFTEKSTPSVTLQPAAR